MQNRRDGKETRADILKAALHLFGEYGYHKTSISMVADKAKVYRSAIAFYFGSKTDLLLGVWEHYVENHLLSLIQELSSEIDNGNRHDILKRMISLWTDNYTADPEQMRATLRLLLDGPQSIPVLSKQAQSLFYNAHQLMEQLIARGQLNRTISREINSNSMANLLMLAILGIQYGCSLCPDICTPEKTTADLHTLSEVFFVQPTMQATGSEGQASQPH